jgi:hypothetical protein
MMDRAARWAWAALVGIVAFLGAPPAEAAQARSVTERVFAFERGGSVSIDSQNGRIVVEAWDRPEVRVQITREARAKSDAQARQLLRALAADVSVEPDRIEIVSVYPKKREVVDLWDLIGQGVAMMNIHYYVQIPKETALELKTSNGGLRVRGSVGSVRAVTSNGGVDVFGVRGPLDVRTSNGEIRLAGIDGIASAMTTNGSVTAEITALPARGRLALVTTNGNVRVTLPKQIYADLEAVTTNGRVRVDYALDAGRAVTTKSVQGRIGGGGVRMKIQTTNGNIDVAPGTARR